MIKDAAFYAYAAPEPAGFKDSAVLPAKAFYSAEKNEFFLMDDGVRLSETAEQTLLDFLSKHVCRGGQSRALESQGVRESWRAEHGRVLASYELAV